MENKFINASSWMRDSLHLIGHRNLFDLVLPGTHDSAAYKFSDDYMPGSQKKSVQFWINIADRLIKNKIKNIEITQTLDIYHQLKKGARYLDIRAGWFKNKWYTYHCHVGPKLSEVLSDVLKFLEKYKCEVVILEISHFRNHSPECFEALQKIICKYLGNFLCPLNPEKKFPIFDIIKQGKRAIVMMPKGFNKKLNIWPDKILKNSYPNKNKIKDIRDYNENRIKDNPKDKLLKISWILTPAGSDLNKNLLKLAKDVNLEQLKSFSKIFLKQKAKKTEKGKKSQEEDKEEENLEEIKTEEIIEEEKVDAEILELEKVENFNDSEPSSEGDDEENKNEEDKNEEDQDEEIKAEEEKIEIKAEEVHIDKIQAEEKFPEVSPGQIVIKTEVQVNPEVSINNPKQNVNYKGTIIIIDNFGESSIMHIIYKLNGIIN